MIGMEQVTRTKAILPPRSHTLVSTSGDFNRDSILNTADHVFWRKSARSPSDDNTWRTRFGEGTGGGMVANLNYHPEHYRSQPRFLAIARPLPSDRIHRIDRTPTPIYPVNPVNPVKNDLVVRASPDPAYPTDRRSPRDLQVFSDRFLAIGIGRPLF
jgi:hypothetical protein